MLPFALTVINVTDMLAKFLMFSKSVDRVDALLSQKPFWRMFEDPAALLVLEEVSLDVLADAVNELKRERSIPHGEHTKEGASNLHGEAEGNVTVFDFATLLKTTEERVLHDLLGAGPKSTDELRAVFLKNREKYVRALERKERAARWETHVPKVPLHLPHVPSAGDVEKAVIDKPREAMKKAVGTLQREVSKRATTPGSPVRGKKKKGLNTPPREQAKEMNDFSPVAVATSEGGDGGGGRHRQGGGQSRDSSMSTTAAVRVTGAATHLAPPDLLGGGADLGAGAAKYGTADAGNDDNDDLAVGGMDAFVIDDDDDDDGDDLL